MNTWQRSTSVLALCFLRTFASAHAQTAAAAVPETSANPADRAWSLLTDTVSSASSAEHRIEALAALGSMGSNDRAARLITDALKDRDLDVRSGAILAAGLTKNSRLLPELRNTLDDDEPRVAYLAAITLWKEMHDRSGEELLMQVATGGRRADATFFKGARHSAARTLRSPAALARIGATQGASILLGPFGVGISAVEYAHKNDGDAARAAAIDLLAEDHSPTVHQAMVEALVDKDPIVRAAAAKALGQWPDPATANALVPLFDDNKLVVQLAAAASYLRDTTRGGSRTLHPRP